MKKLGSPDNVFSGMRVGDLFWRDLSYNLVASTVVYLYWENIDDSAYWTMFKVSSWRRIKWNKTKESTVFLVQMRQVHQILFVRLDSHVCYTYAILLTNRTPFHVSSSLWYFWPWQSFMCLSSSTALLSRFSLASDFSTRSTLTVCHLAALCSYVWGRQMRNIGSPLEEL